MWAYKIGKSGNLKVILMSLEWKLKGVVCFFYLNLKKK